MDGSSMIEQTVISPINVYGIKQDDREFGNQQNYYAENIGWILLSVILAIGLIIFIILWALCLNEQHNQQPASLCFGAFGVETGVDSDALNICGTSSNNPCIFSKNSLTDAENECNTLKSICNAFTFNAITSTMKIVNSSNKFVSPSTNLFVRQSNSVL